MPRPLHADPPGRGRRLLGLLGACLLLAGLVAPADAAVVEPSLRLVGPGGEVTMFRYGRGEPVYLDLGVQVGAIGAPLELLAQRVDYTQPQTLTQVLRGPGNDSELRPLDPALLDGWSGLKD